MRNPKGALVLFFALGIACTSPPVETNTKNHQANVVQNVVANRVEIVYTPLTSLVQVPDQSKASGFEYFGSGIFIRNSQTKNDSGRMIPPYHSAELTAGLTKAPVIGDKVTVVPLIDGIEPFLLPIRSSDSKSEGCSEEDQEEYWEVSFEPIRSKRILEISAIEGRADEFPFDVFVIYPAVDFARQIPAGDLRPEDLPAAGP